MKAIFVTTNEHKRREVQEILGVELEGATGKKRWFFQAS